MSVNDRIDAATIPDAARRRQAIATLDRAWTVVRENKPNATANDVAMLLGSMSTSASGQFSFVTMNQSAANPAMAQAYRDALSIHNARNNILLRRPETPAPAAAAAPAAPATGRWNIPSTIDFNDEVYFVGANVRGQRPNPDHLAAGFMTHWNGNRNDAAVRGVLNSVMRPDRSYPSDVSAILYDRYKAATDAGRSEEAGVIGDAMAYLSLRATFRRAQEAGDTMERPNYDQFRASAIARGQRASEARHVGSSQQQALREADFTATVFVERQGNLRMPDADRRRQAVAVLDQYYNSVNNDNNPNNDVTFAQALTNIENAKRRGNSGHSDRALDDATGVLRRQQQIEAENPQAASQAVRIRSGVTEADGRPANPAARGPVNLRGPNVDPLAQALLEIVPVPGDRQNVRQLISTAMQANGGANGDPAAVLGHLYTQFNQTPQTDRAQRNQLAQAIGVVYRVADLETLRAANTASTPPIDYRDTAQFQAYIGRATNFARAVAENNEALANENMPGNGAPAAAGPGAPAAAASGARRGRYTNDERSAIIQRSAGRYQEIDPAIQARLEALGHSTGQRAGTDVSSADNLDGLLGDRTKAAIEAVLGRSVTVPLSEADMTALNTALENAPARGAAPATPATAPAASAPAAAAPAADSDNGAALALSRQAAVRAMAANRQNESDNNYSYGGFASDETIRNNLLNGLRAAGVNPSEAQLRNLTVNGGIISSPDIRRLEEALNAIRGDAPAFTVDGIFDPRLKAVLESEGVSTFLGSVFNGTQVASSAAPAATPGNAGNGGPNRS